MSDYRQEENIYSSQVVQALEQKYCSSCSAAVVSSCLVSSQGLGARVVSRIYHGGRQVVYTATATAMLLQNMAPAAQAADIYVSSGVTSSGLVMSGGTINVLSGGTTIDTVLNSTGKEYVLGTASGTTVYTGGSQSVYGVANNTTVNASGWQGIWSGGVANNTTVNSRGYMGVQASGAVANSATINSGGSQLATYGGVANNATINSGGSQFVYSRGVANDTIVSNGGRQLIRWSGLASNARVNSGGLQEVLATGLADGTIINSGGRQEVRHSGAVANNTIVNGGGVQSVYSSGVASNTTIKSGGAQEVQSGGSSFNVTQLVGGNINTYVIGGNTTYVTGTNEEGQAVTLAGGVASNFIINSDGFQYISSGGLTNNVKVNLGGTQHVSDGGIASSTVIAGGIQHVSGGGQASDATLNAGAQVLYNGGKAFNAVVNNNATQQVLNGAIASNTTLSGGELHLSSGGLVNMLAGQSGAVRVYGEGQLTGNAVLSGTVVDYTPSLVSRNNLQVENLSATDAVFNMRVDLENQTGDQLTVQSAYDGTAQIAVTNMAATAQETTGDGIKLVEFTDPSNANGTFTLVGGKYDEGAYSYELLQGTKAGLGKDYFLRVADYAPVFKTMLNMPVMNVIVAQTGMNSLQRRLGDLQNMDNTDKKQGVWVRSYYRDVTVKDLAKTDLKLFGAEAGYDWLFRADEPTKLYAGVLIGYVNLNSTETRQEDGSYAKGDGESPTVGVYATLVNENGWFVDIAARNFWTKLDMTSHNSNGTETTYKPERNVVALSAEAGKSFAHTLSKDTFIRLEPKAEVGWMRAAEGSTQVYNGVDKLHYDAADYINAKGALLLSYNTKYAGDLLLEPLVEVAYRYEFEGKDDVSYGGATERSSLRGNGWEVNAGLNMQLTKDLYWYALGSYENGRKERGWGVYAGVRYKFGKDYTEASKPEEKVVPMPVTQPAVVEVPEGTYYMLFKLNEHMLSSAAKTAITEFAKDYLNAHDKRQILVEGYACDLGREEYNQALSRRRAEEVRDWLMRQGIDAQKITIKAYGETRFGKENFGQRSDYRRVVISVHDK